MNKPTVLVLDFGGVISRTLFETHAESERALALPAGTLTWLGPFDPTTDSHWQRMQAGEISERDYWVIRSRETGELIGQHWTTMQQFVVAARGADPAAVIRPECEETINRVQSAGCRLAILSNELDLFYGAELRQKLPLLNSIDMIVDATYTGILKPDQRAYALVTDGLGVQPSDCVFVDDQLRNIDGARAAGMHVVHFDVQAPQRSYNEALRALGLT